MARLPVQTDVAKSDNARAIAAFLGAFLPSPEQLHLGFDPGRAHRRHVIAQPRCKNELRVGALRARCDQLLNCVHDALLLCAVRCEQGATQRHLARYTSIADLGGALNARLDAFLERTHGRRYDIATPYELTWPLGPTSHLTHARREYERGGAASSERGGRKGQQLKTNDN